MRIKQVISDKIESRRGSGGLFNSILIATKDFLWLATCYLQKPRRIYEDLVLRPNKISSIYKLESKIPNRYFYYWSGPKFQYVHYLSVISLIKTTNPKQVKIYFEVEPKSFYWRRLHKLKQVEIIKLRWETLLEKKIVERDWSKLNMNHKSDLFRYLVIYKYGGIYLDFDTLSLEDLGQLRNNQCFAGYENPLWEYGSKIVNGSIIGSVRRYHVIKACIDLAIKSIEMRERLEWADLGPFVLTRVFNSYKDHVQIYKNTYFYPYSANRWREIFQDSPLPEETKVIHFWGKHSTEYTKTINRRSLFKKDALYFKKARAYA